MIRALPDWRPARRIGAVLLVAALGLPGAAAADGGLSRPDAPVLLVSLDGFRWDYPELGHSPNLGQLAAQGVRAESLRPVFPSKTFPSHYSMVTGLYPQHHGIVSNRFYDPRLDRDFRIDRPTVSDPAWWGGEPIWITAQRQGRRTATMFWPGSDVEIAGERPTYWTAYDGRMPHRKRVARVLGWLDLPADERPDLITLYFSDVDSAGHDHGPDSAEIRAAIARVDRSLGELLRGLIERGIRDAVQLVIVSDHGMIASSPDRVIAIDRYIDLRVVRVADWDPNLALWPEPGREEEIYRRLRRVPHLRTFRRSEIPRRLRYRSHERIPPLLAMAEPGWRISTKTYLERHPDRFTGGTHGYDDRVREMHGIFVAHGPAFPSGKVVETFRNVHVYTLLCHLLGIEAAPNDGAPSAIRPLLRDGE